MVTRIELLALGQSMEEGTITAWHKKEGDPVAKGEPLYNVMTDKADFEQEAPESGILRRILVPVDEIAPVGALLAVIAGADDAIDEALSPPEGASAASQAPAPAVPPAPRTASPADQPAPIVFASPRARRTAGEMEIDVRALAGRGSGIDGRIVEADVVAFGRELADAPRARATPLAQKLAQGCGLDVAALAGSGHGGKVVADDVRKATAAPVEPVATGILKTVPLTGMRKMIADNVARSASTAPHVTLAIPVDMTEATEFRKKILEPAERTHGVRISFTDIIAKAAAASLVTHPAINSTLQDNVITQYRSAHIGIAVSRGEGGLVVPTIRDAHLKTLSQISVEIKSLAAKAREGKLTTEEMTGATFTITNLGAHGVETFDPIINPPQCAILGVCAIRDSVVAICGAPRVRPMMNLCLSFDHRITDGVPAAAFLADLKQILEQPYLMFV